VNKDTDKLINTNIKQTESGFDVSQIFIYMSKIVSFIGIYYIYSLYIFIYNYKKKKAIRCAQFSRAHSANVHGLDCIWTLFCFTISECLVF